MIVRNCLPLTLLVLEVRQAQKALQVPISEINTQLSLINLTNLNRKNRIEYFLFWQWKYHGKVFDTKVQLSILITKFMACIQCLPIIDTKNAICFLALFKRKALGTWSIFIFYAVSDLPALQAHQGVLFHQFHPEMNRY
jgi:hypothetical protein